MQMCIKIWQANIVGSVVRICPKGTPERICVTRGVGWGSRGRYVSRFPKTLGGVGGQVVGFALVAWTGAFLML